MKSNPVRIVMARGPERNLFSSHAKMLRLASKRVALPSRRVLVRLQSTKPPLPPVAPATTAPLPAPAATPLPPPSNEVPPAPEPAGTLKNDLKASAEQPEVPKPSAPQVPPAPEVAHEAAAAGRGAASRLRSLLVSSLLFLGTGALLVYAYDSRAGIHRCVRASREPEAESDPHSRLSL